jgi:aminopeptidase N
MLWQSLWDGVRAAHYPLNDFMRTAMANVGAEKDYTLLGEAIEKIESGVYYLKATGAPAGYVASTLTGLQQIAWKGIEDNGANPDFARRWFGLYQEVASDMAGLDKLAALLKGEVVLKGVPVDQDLRWSLIATLNRYDYPNSAALIEAELLRDKSDSGKNAALSASVIRPDASIKAQWLARIEDPKSDIPFPRLRVAMGALFPVEQMALAEASAAQRLARLPAIDKASDPVFMRSYGYAMIPMNCSEAGIKRLDQAIAQYQDLSAGTMRSLKSRQDSEKRCVAIRNAMTVDAQ